MNNIFFTPGPSALYFTTEQHIKNALKNNILSISHRSKEYVKIQQATTEGLQQLLNLPSNFTIGYLSSATEVWERMSENLIQKDSTHLVNGSFSEKFYKSAISIGKNATSIVTAPGTNHDLQNIDINTNTELISLAQNETSTGASMPLEDIGILRKRFEKPLLAIDSVSSLPIPKYDFNTLDSLYFSVQKSFGLPAGLGVWLFNERCLEKAEHMKASGTYHDSYNGILNLKKFAAKHQTSCTPNVLNIYLLGKVVEDMLAKGIDQIRQESKYKSALIYNLFETHPSLSTFVTAKKFRSETVGVAEVKGGSEKLIQKLSEKGLHVGNGYSQFKNKHIRIANFPTHSKEQIEMLVDTVNEMEF